MRDTSKMTEVAPNVFKASEKCYYIRVASGALKFCSAERFEKLVHRHNGDMSALVNQYRERVVAPKAPVDPTVKIASLKAEIAQLEAAQASAEQPAAE